MNFKTSNLQVEARKGQLESDESSEPSPAPTSSSKPVLQMSDDMVMAQCLLFFIAGFDTVANLIAMCTYVLAANPELQEKVRGNVEKATSSNGEINYDTTSQMDYIDMLIAGNLFLFVCIITFVL